MSPGSDAIRQLRWDDRYKIGGEHTDFFLRAKGRLKVGVHAGVEVLHRPQRSPEYQKMRMRAMPNRHHCLKKHGFTALRNELMRNGDLLLDEGLIG